MASKAPDLSKVIERLHRRYLDVVRAELVRQGIRDLTAVQAMLLTNIGDEEIMIRDLIDRGYYQGSNVSYNVKKLTDYGYLEQRRSEQDKRSVRVSLTDKSKDVCKLIVDMEARNAAAMEEAGMSEDDVKQLRTSLRHLELIWGDLTC